MNIAVDNRIRNGTSYYDTITIDNTVISCHYNTEFSCGIKAISGIQRLASSLEGDSIKIKESINLILGLNWKTGIRLSGAVASMIQMSINEDNPELTKVLDELCDYKTDWHVNPNSGNNIRIYTFVVNK